MTRWTDPMTVTVRRIVDEKHQCERRQIKFLERLSRDATDDRE